MDENLMQTLECFGLCMNRADAADHFLQMEEWEKLFDILVCIAIDQKDVDTAEKAVVVVISILKSLVTAVDQPSSLLFSKSIEIMSMLISSQNICIVEQTLDLLFILLQDSEITRRISSTTMSPDLINDLALLASKNFIVEESMRAKLAQTFSVLIHDIKNIHFFARQTQIIAFLVCLANGSYCETDQGRGQKISICMLMKLARNPCNRRILAKQPGLLSSLIRYARTTPESVDGPAERNISRKEMKDQILLIAKAL